MLKDAFPSYQPPGVSDLKITDNFEVDKIFAFIDKNIPNFPSYYQSVKDSYKENRVTDILIHHFQLCKVEQSGGFFPYDFRKNPTQLYSDKETDIGVFVMTRNQKPIPIVEFEAKRFSESSNNKEYVCGITGGIERFKRGHHASHLKICGMFGYVQSKTSAHWIVKVNNWIKELSENNSDKTIDWTTHKELLIKVNSFPSVEKLSSIHVRKQSDDTIALWHYLIELFGKS